ncbi:hypothetical protein ACYSNU_05025 [Enterococcus sp. LJL120]
MTSIELILALLMLAVTMLVVKVVRVNTAKKMLQQAKKVQQNEIRYQKTNALKYYRKQLHAE